MKRMRIHRVTISAIFLALLAWAPCLQAEGKRVLPRISSISGTGGATLHWGNERSDLRPGQRFAYGSIITTGADVIVRVIFPDDTLLNVHPNTEIEIQEWTGQLQATRLEAGQIRTTTRPREAREESPEREKKLRFLIRTKAAVLGVRGTDFILTVDPIQVLTQLHTLEGVVEIAQSEQNLLSGAGTSVRENQFVEAIPGKITPPQPFEREEFLQLLEHSAPAGNEDRQPEVSLASFQLSAAFPGFTGGFLNWTPEFQLPQLPYLGIRGHIGLGWAGRSSDTKRVRISEQQIFAKFKFLGTPFFSEVGYGVQNRPSLNESLFSVNVGAELHKNLDQPLLKQAFIGIADGHFRMGIGFGF